MKNTLLLLSFVLMSIFAFGQSPQAFKYQAVARDLNGNPVINQEISVKISILSGSPEGTVEYCELHQTTTNSLGLINLEVGRGTTVTGNFAMIAWGNNASFVKIEMDLAGGDNFVFMGTSQLLSVPYALYSGNGIRSMTTDERDALVSPFTGMQIYNSTSNCLNYFNGIAWFETCGQCTPMPTQADAGEDQYFADATSTTNLQGNIPEHGTGTWTIESGTGGSFADANNPQTQFTGQLCESYLLKWTISSVCGSTYDSISVAFFTTPTTANAGEDQTNVQATWTTLAANSPLIGQGHWTIIQGIGGQLVSPNSPNSIFLGQDNSLYLLEWKINTPCANSIDSAQIIFGCAPQPTNANAGIDQLIYGVINTILQGNDPIYGTGQWSIISGAGGNIANPEDPISIFVGQTGETYELKWAISNSCGTSNDDVTICFWECGMSFSDTRDGKVYTTVEIGNQCWMAQNLNIGTRIDGGSNQGNNSTISKYCLNNSEVNCEVYGGLYQWGEMMNYSNTQGLQGICPLGWHLPTDTEWTTLTNFLGGEGDAGGKMKETGTSHWITPNTGATNTSGFTGLPAGNRSNGGSFGSPGYYAHIWSSTQSSTANAFYWSLYHGGSYISHYPYGTYKTEGLSVRCLKD